MSLLVEDMGSFIKNFICIALKYLPRNLFWMSLLLGTKQTINPTEQKSAFFVLCTDVFLFYLLYSLVHNNLIFKFFTVDIFCSSILECMSFIELKIVPFLTQANYYCEYKTKIKIQYVLQLICHIYWAEPVILLVIIFV